MGIKDFQITTPILQRITEIENNFLTTTDGNEKLVIELTYGEILKLTDEIGATNKYYNSLTFLLANPLGEITVGISIFRLSKTAVKEKIITLK